MKHIGRFSASEGDVQLIQEYCQARARKSFSAFRRWIRPDLIVGWWTRKLEEELQAFYQDYIAGNRPRLAILAPPQHGKSTIVNDFVAYVAGCNPATKIVYATYSDELGTRANVDLQRTILSESYRRIYPHTRVSQQGWQRNQSLIEFVGAKGSFRNTTVSGAVTGFQLQLGIIDDPTKGRQEAGSKQMRDRVWNWFTDDFLARFSDNGALLVIMTRWHVDDLLGRLEKRSPGLKVLRYSAIAEHDEEHRVRGEPLFPELKPLDFLEQQRKHLTEASWQSLYLACTRFG